MLHGCHIIIMNITIIILLLYTYYNNIKMLYGFHRIIKIIYRFKIFTYRLVFSYILL